MDRCRSLPSFRRYVEENPQERARLLLDDKAFAAAMAQGIERVDQHSAIFHLLTCCLHGFVKDLPGCPLGKQLYSVYLLCLLKNVAESHEYREAFQLLKYLSMENMRAKLQGFCDVLAGKNNGFSANQKSLFSESPLEDVKVMYKQAKNLLEQLTSLSSGATTCPSTPPAHKSSPAIGTPKSGQKLSRLELQKVLYEA